MSIRNLLLAVSLTMLGPAVSAQQNFELKPEARDFQPPKGSTMIYDGRAGAAVDAVNHEFRFGHRDSLWQAIGNLVGQVNLSNGFTHGFPRMPPNEIAFRSSIASDGISVPPYFRLGLTVSPQTRCFIFWTFDGKLKELSHTSTLITNLDDLKSNLFWIAFSGEEEGVPLDYARALNYRGDLAPDDYPFLLFRYTNMKSTLKMWVMNYSLKHRYAVKMSRETLMYFNPLSTTRFTIEDYHEGRVKFQAGILWYADRPLLQRLEATIDSTSDPIVHPEKLKWVPVGLTELDGL